MNKMPISAVIIVKNGERYLDRVLRPLANLCDDLVVLDSDSTDNTIAIALAYGARVERQTFLGYGPQKRLAVSLAKHDWILSLDADEVLDEAVCAAIQQLDLQDANTAYEILRRNHIGQDEIRFGVWAPDWCLRLFNRSVTNFSEEKIHESVMKTKHTVQLSGSMLHYSYVDCADVFMRMGSYMRAKADRYTKEGRHASVPRLLVRAAWGFIRSYVIRQGFRDGVLGVVVALSVAIDSVAGLAIAAQQKITTDEQ
jgi:glycosyltransferase involved in cell wall biosynthesis